MRLDDGRTHRKADAHAVLAAVCRYIRVGAGEQRFQPFSGDAAAIVRHLEHRTIAHREHLQGQFCHALGVQSGIFQQVHQHLLDEHGIHGDHDKGIRRFQLHRDLRVALAELDQHRIQQFVQHSGGLLHRHLLAVDAGDGKQILHHAGQPLGIAAGFAKQFNGLFLIQRVIIFDHSGAGTVDGGERGAQIVRNRAQKVCTHLLLLAFHTQLFLLFDAGGEGAGHDGHHQHHKAGEQVFRQGKVEGEIR